jgi:hypothetical protein
VVIEMPPVQHRADGYAQLAAWGALEIKLDQLKTELAAIDITARQPPWIDRCYLALRRRMTLAAIERTKASMRSALRS